MGSHALHDESCIMEQQVTDAPYDLRRLKTPVLGGWLLTAFVWIAESWIFKYLIGKKLMRDSGIPQASVRAMACLNMLITPHHRC